MLFPQLVASAAARVSAFLEAGTDFATRDAADVIRRGRAFGLIALVLLGAGAGVAALRPQLHGVVIALVVAMVVVSISMSVAGLQGGRFARLAMHLALGRILATLTAGAVQLGTQTSINVTMPSLVVLVACHILGVRAAAVWTIAAELSLAIALFLPDSPDGPEALTLRFATRSFIILGFLWIAVAGRRVADERAEEIDFLARHDSLTGLMSRWEFEQHLSDSIARSRRYKRSLALIFIDLDRFKEVNDTYGHVTGDAVLKVTAQRIASTTRESDAAARLGGDEFLVLLDEVSGERAARLCADRMVALLSRPIYVEAQQIQLSASAGVALCPADAEDIEALTRAGDQAMYAAKRERGGAVRLRSGIGGGEGMAAHMQQ